MREGLFDHHRLDSVSIVGASLAGLVQGEKIFGPVPQGYAWYVENYAHLLKGQAHNVSVTWAITVDDGPLGGQAGGLAAWDGQGLVGSLNSTIAGNFLASPPNYMGPGHVLHALASAAFGASFAVGDLVTCTVQIAVHQLDPHFIMGPDDAVQVKAAHERMAAELNQDAVGARAN